VVEDDRAHAPTADGAARPVERPACPSCGSAHTQPFTHAGPGARVNMKCLDCGTLFKHRPSRH